MCQTVQGQLKWDGVEIFYDVVCRKNEEEGE